ncbi:DUF5719 family protein [Microbacterium dauci]|uniref:DUF5719 family protein n=1 Tax=Microbacterium dauci TaxID=3048008 RepID=A0ABT6ZBE0_9MICO|nr:DUF5719 family protein [Microbacterium sp. LX3-4]MDJ1112952.1 DUF5719 family protein [Microbacterium sp. LX3-4]
MSGIRSGARIALGAALSAGIVAAVALAVPATWPTVTREVQTVTAAPEPSTSRLACGGSTLALGRDIEDVSALQAAGAQRVTVGSTPGTEATSGEIAPADVPDGRPAAAFTAEPQDGARTDLAAAGSTSVDADDLAGFAASACTPPAMESWLIAGSGLTGAADLVVIANPGDVASRVALTVYGATGETTPDAGADILVPAGSQRVVPLAALALGEQSPVVLVSATQAPVQATLQSSITRTLVPGGIDQAGATAAPDTTQTIPAVVGTSDAGVGASVRLLAPSDDTTARLTVTPVGETEPVFEVDGLALVAGVPLEVDVDELPAGRYRVDLEAAAPVVSSLWSATGIGAGSDFAWFAAADAISVPTLFAVAAGPAPRLTLTAEGDADVEVELTAAAGGGVASTVLVPAGGSVTVPVDARSVYLLDARDETIRANITYAGDGAIASYAVAPADAAAAPVVVRPR